jgi:hypothetical protein
MPGGRARRQAGVMTQLTDRPRPGWPRWTHRIVAAVAALLLFTQSVTAGIFIGDRDAHPVFGTHRTMAFIAALAVLLLLVAAIVLAVAGGGGGAPVIGAAIVLALVLGEIAAGFLKVVPLHVPLGVLTILTAAVVAVAAWFPERRRVVAAA